jgi:AraC-like DNA-binding protein
VNASLVERRLSPHAIFRDWIFGERLEGRPVAHPGVEIGWCLTGCAEYAIADQVIRVKPGAAVVIPVAVEHATSVVQPGTRGRSIHLTRDAFEAAADAVGARVRDARLIEGSTERPSPLVTLAGLLARESEDERAGRAMAVEALMDAVVVEALRSGAAAATVTRDPRVGRAIDLMQDRYASALTLDDLAGAAGISRFHFSRLFRAKTGKSPFRYLLDVRVARAAQLLRTRGCSVTEAAFTVGCADLGRFSRRFRKLHGVAPSEYLRRVRSAGAIAA